jgi:hypothetical protein
MATSRQFYPARSGRSATTVAIMPDLHARHLEVLKAIREGRSVNPSDAEELNGTLIVIADGAYALTVEGRRAPQDAEADEGGGCGHHPRDAFSAALSSNQGSPPAPSTTMAPMVSSARDQRLHPGASSRLAAHAIDVEQGGLRRVRRGAVGVTSMKSLKMMFLVAALAASPVAAQITSSERYERLSPEDKALVRQNRSRIDELRAQQLHILGTTEEQRAEAVRRYKKLPPEQKANIDELQKQIRVLQEENMGLLGINLGK